MKRTLPGAFVLAAALALSGCGSVAKSLNIVNPTYTLRNVQPRVALALPLSASAIDFDFDLGVDNQNAVGLSLSGVTFDVLVNDNRLVSSVSEQRVNIPARGYGVVHLRARVGYNEIRSIFQQVTDVIQGNRARYELRGTASYDTPVGRLNFPVTVYANR
jgi:LEA14-like dessication related protein